MFRISVILIIIRVFFFIINCNESSGVKRDLSFLTNLPGARDGLQIFEADFENPESFEPAIEGCVGVFHVAHPIDLNDEESEETVTKKSVEATLSILRTCLKSKTVKKVVYTSSLAAVLAKEKIPPILNEDVWSDVDFLKKLSFTGRSYGISKTETERAVLEFAEKNPIELVTLIPSWIHGPFVCPNLPGFVHSSLALFLGSVFFNYLLFKSV